MAQILFGKNRDPPSPRSDPSTRESRYSIQFDATEWPRPTSTQEASSFQTLVNNYPNLSVLDLVTQSAVVSQIYLSGRFRPAIRAGAIATYFNNELGIYISPFDVKSLRNMLGTTPYTSQILERSQEPIDGLIDSYLEVDAWQERIEYELMKYKMDLDDSWLKMSLSENRTWREKWNAEAFWRDMPIHPKILTYGYVSSPNILSFVQRYFPVLEMPTSDLFSIIATIWLSHFKVWPDAISPQRISTFIYVNLGLSLDPHRILEIRNELLFTMFHLPNNPKANHAMLTIIVTLLQDVDRWWEYYLQPLDRECLIVLWGAGAKVKLLESTPYELQGSGVCESDLGEPGLEHFSSA